MRLSDYRNSYYEFSGKASDVARHLAFAGIAVIWVFKVNDGTLPRLPPPLVLPTAVLAMGLASDLLQYSWATLAWGVFHRYHEGRRTPSDPDPALEAPRWLNWPSLFFFWTKLAAVATAYALIIRYTWQVWLRH